MVNPRLGILGLGLNPKRKRRKVARRSAKARMAYARSFQKNRRRRRRSYRRNPYPVAGIALNPRRRRHRRNPVMNRRRYRRNPGGKILGLSLPPLQSVLYAGVGFVAVPITEGFLNQFLPLSITSTTLGKYAVRIGSVIGLTWLSKMVLGKNAATMVGIGGGAYVLVSAVKEFAPGMIPGLECLCASRWGLSRSRGLRSIHGPEL